ncbi:MAG: hypothetical protein JJ916_10375 [Phycisphaerales bacterium]|nr:hypothetical protein [Phycisphaerales bacterium]
MKLHAIDMCVQLGRFLGREMDLTFVEPSSSAKGNIYADKLPAKKHRLSPALVISQQPSADDEVLGVTQRIDLVIHAEGDSNSEVMQLLGEVQNLLFPNSRYEVKTEGEYMPGVIGVPSEVGTHYVWRLTGMQQLTFPQTAPRSPGGQAVAEFAIETHAVQYTATVEE